MAIAPKPSFNPSMLTVPEAADLLGIGRTLAYDLVRRGQWPTPVVRIGRLIKVPSGPVFQLLTRGSTLSAVESVDPPRGVAKSLSKNS